MVRVTAAVFEDGGEILIAKRRRGGRLYGLWGFPGGKTEDGEDPRDCLARELHEEFGISEPEGRKAGSRTAAVRDGDCHTDFFHGPRAW